MEIKKPTFRILSTECKRIFPDSDGENHSADLDEIKQKITEALFKIKDGKVRVRTGSPRSNRPQYIPTECGPRKLNRMLNLIAERVYRYSWQIELDDIARCAELEIEYRLGKIREYLESYAEGAEPGNQRNRLFNKKAVNDAMEILRKNAIKRLREQIDKPKNMSSDVKGFIPVNPRSPAWQEEQENPLIAEIRDIFKTRIRDHQDLRDHLIYFVAEIFRVCGLWDGKNCFERMAKRFKKLG